MRYSANTVEGYQRSRSAHEGRYRHAPQKGPHIVIWRSSITAIRTASPWALTIPTRHPCTGAPRASVLLIEQLVGLIQIEAARKLSSVRARLGTTGLSRRAIKAIDSARPGEPIALWMDPLIR